MATLRYLDESLSFEERASDLVSQMTLTEKVSQMLHGSYSIERLGIPSYNWWCEALHGVARAGVATMFPQAIGMAATFDPQLIEKEADVISTEGRAKYHEFQRKGDHDIYKGLTFWSPTINIDRDPRWGRGQESYGEDPYLTSRLAVAFIQGIQGKDPKYLKAAACAKHFAVHSGPEAGRHQFNAFVSQKDLWETYMPAFEAAVKEAKVEGVMGAYNMVNGEPCCGSKTLLKDILREEWNFEGYVTSDCWAIKDFNEGHKVTKCEKESAILAVKNGCDLNCGSAYANLVRGCQEGLINEKDIDKSVYNLMLTRMKLGMFDNQKKVLFAATPYEANDCEAHKQVALEVAEKSLVLLRNKDNLLPLDRNKIQSIAVIGSNADSRSALIGNYSGTASEYVTVLDGIRQSANRDTRVFYAEGCHLVKLSESTLTQKSDRIAEALSAAERADAVILCLGLDATIEGEEGDTSNEFASGDRSNLDLPSQQQELLEAVTQTGKPVVLVLLSGSAIAVNWADEHVNAIIQAWYPGAQGGRAIASLLFGDFSPSGKLPVTFYRSDKDLPDFNDYSMENRTYRYMTAEPLYPFGFGLSYTKFEFSQLALDAGSIQIGSSMGVEVAVKNVGNFEAVEIIELYLQDLDASVRVPKWQLAGIKNVQLKPGDSTVVHFTISARQMALINNDGNCFLESGEFRVYVGGTQPDKRSEELTGLPVLSADFSVLGDELNMIR